MNPGMNTQQPWNVQREAPNQAAMHNQSFAAQVQNRPPSNPIAYSTNFTNQTTQQQAPSDFNPMQNRPPAINQMPNNQSEQNAAIKENFMKFLQMQNVDGRVVVAGRSIELWELWHAVRKYDTQSGNSVRARFAFFSSLKALRHFPGESSIKVSPDRGSARSSHRPKSSAAMAVCERVARALYPSVSCPSKCQKPSTTPCPASGQHRRTPAGAECYHAAKRN